jgi:perosamine synthetase
MSELAIEGGPKAKPTPYQVTNRYGEEEMKLVQEVLESGRLMGVDGKVKDFEVETAKYFGVSHAIMVTSGTAALHVALAALGVSEGDEVITNPMTDIGTVAAILAMHAIPVFVDIDPKTRLISPEGVRDRITDKTKAMITVHMAGMPCPLDDFLKIREETGVRLLEDCAQAHGARYKGKLVGTIGDAAGFSMNESKQMSTGDGGFVLTNDDEVGRIAALYRDKTYVRGGGLRHGMQPVPFFALNYRPTCLQAAVGIGQLHKLEGLVERREAVVRRYYNELADVPHLEFPQLVDGAEASWWPLGVQYTGSDPSRDDIVEALKAEGVPAGHCMSAVRNILRTEMIQNRQYYHSSDEPPMFWRDTEYDADGCPNVDALQDGVIRLPVDERYSDEDISQTIAAVKKVFAHYFK